MGYDIFISYKLTDGNGNHTKDYQIAYNLYQTLTSYGYNTFSLHKL